MDLDKKDVCFVQWGQNSVNQYRIGYQEKYDLLYYVPPHSPSQPEARGSSKKGET